MRKTENFVPAFELDIDTLTLIQDLVGKKFNNQELLIDFNGIVNHIHNNEEIVELSIEHIGISGQFYLLYSEVQRILGVNIKLLSQEYIEYVFHKNIGNYGVQFKKFIDKNEIEQLPLLIPAITSLQDKQYSIYFSTCNLMVDSGFLSSKKCNWPKTLSLSLDFKISQVALDIEKVSELSNEDLILLRNK